jgi:C-terminal processing protease CtpA/Prc
VERLPEGAIYVRYPAVFDIPQATIDELDAMSAAHPDERIILDLRQNPGGDNHNYATLLSHLTAPTIIGRLFVLTDRVTFSAAANFSTEIEQKTDAVFVGEAPGGGLNFWDDVTWEHLDDYVVPMRVAISVRYWQKSTPDDPRLTIEPDLPVPTLAADYFAGRDPVLDAALEAPLD